MKKLLLALSVLIGLTLAPNTVLAGDTSGVTVTTNPAAPVCNTQNSSTLPSQLITTVDILPCAFNPQEITVTQGATVVWTNQDTAQHSVKGTDFNSGMIGTHNQFAQKFDQAGRFTYVDEKSGASGVVNVVPGQAAATTAITATTAVPSATPSVPSAPEPASTVVPTTTTADNPKDALPATGPAGVATVGGVFLGTGIVSAIGYQLYQRRQFA